jgi:hypothetical protein
MANSRKIAMRKKSGMEISTPGDLDSVPPKKHG